MGVADCDDVRHDCNRYVVCAGRVFEFVLTEEPGIEPVVSHKNVSKIVPTLLESLQDEPHIAEKVCYAFSELASALKQGSGESLLSPYFKDIVAALLQAVSPQIFLSLSLEEDRIFYLPVASIIFLLHLSFVFLTFKSKLLHLSFVFLTFKSKILIFLEGLCL